MNARPAEMQAPTFVILDGRSTWPTGEGQGAQEDLAASVTGLSLAAAPRGPRALLWSEGSLGGLVLPRGFVFDEQGRLYLLEPAAPWRVLRYTPETQSFEPLPGVGCAGQQPRQFSRPLGLAVAGSHLYVADSGNRRVQVFDLTSLALHQVFDTPFRSPQPRPLDVAAHGRHAYVLAGNRVYRHTARRMRLETFIRTQQPGLHWRRIAVDRQGQIYLLRRLPADPPPPDCPGAPAAAVTRFRGVLDIYSPAGLYLRTVDEASQVCHQFNPPSLHLTCDRDRRAYFCLPAHLAQACSIPGVGAAAEHSGPEYRAEGADYSGAGSGAPCSGLIFNRSGQPAQPDPSELLETPAYTQAGTWISRPLDSQIYQCQWHRIELDLANLPPGSRFKLSTYSSGSDYSRPLPDSPLWQVACDATGAPQPAPDDPSLQTGCYAIRPELPTDCLVQSRQGQYLWIKVDLYGDGFESPVLHSLRVHYPRQSYLDYLPAVYASDDESRWFLERFLSIFQNRLEVFEQRLENISRYFDVEAVPPGPFLDMLARWYGLPLEEVWDAEQRRNLLRVVQEIYPRCGTPAGLRRYLQVYVQNLTGIAPAEQGEHPLIVEGFRERRRLLLDGAGAPHGQVRSLWSPAVVARLQVGRDLPVGAARLVSPGEPASDLFQHYGHRFSIYLPASWVRTAADEQMLRRAVDAEKPAHTIYDLRLVEPHFRIGVQSTLGVDTLLGCYPVLRLTCPQALAQAAPSRSPRNRLGYDTVLGGTAAPQALPIPVNILLG